MQDGLQVKPLGKEGRMALESAVRRYESQLWEVMAYLGERGITRDTAERFRLGYTGGLPMPGHPARRLSIPCLTARHPVYLSFRAVVDDDEPKYLHIPGVSRMFNSRAIVEAADEIHVTEGQLDAVVLEQCGMHAIGVMGARAWKSHHARMLAGFSRVFVWADSDNPGNEFAAKVCEGVPQATTIRIKGGAKDVNDLFLSGGAGAVMDAFKDEAA